MDQLSLPMSEGRGFYCRSNSQLLKGAASLETNRTLSRSTLTVQDMTVDSAIKPILPSIDTPRCDLRPTPGTALQPTKRRERFSCPGVYRLTVLRSLVTTIVSRLSRLSLNIHRLSSSPPAGGGLFIPMSKARGLQARRGKR